MTKTKIISTQKGISNTKTGIIVSGNPSKSNIAALSKLLNTNGRFFIFQQKDWKKSLREVDEFLKAQENGSLIVVNTVLQVLEEKEMVCFLPLSNIETQAQANKLATRLERVDNSAESILMLNKNTGNVKGFFGKFFSFMANFWARVFTGLDAQNTATGIVCFQKESYTLLAEKYGNLAPLLLAKLAYTEGINIGDIDGDFDEPSFSFGAGFSSIIKGKIFVFNFIVSHYFKHPLKAIKTNKFSFSNSNAPLFKLAFGSVAAIIFAIMTFTATDYNVTWDEPNHVTFSKDVLSYYKTFGEDTAIFNTQNRDYQTNILYGMSFDTFCALVQDVTGLHEYNVRRIINAWVGFLCILLTSLLARQLFGWRAALLALLAMFFSPSFYGQAFNNPKDIPLAMGYVMTALFLTKTLQEMPKPRMQTLFLLAVSIGFSISIRASGLVQIGFVLAFLGLHWLISKKDIKPAFKTYLFSFLFVAIIGYFIGVISWPYALRDPLHGPLNAFKEFSNFAYLQYYELFEGVRIKDKPWYYEPKLIVLTAPIMVLAGLILFAMLILIKPDKSKQKTLLLLLILVMTFAPSAYAIYKKSYVYNGWRHFLFIYPTLVILSIWGWEKLMQLLKKINLLPMISFVVAILMLLPAAFFSIRNHPYQYMYFNEIAGGVKGAAGNYELDYWCQTPRAAFEWLIKNVPEVKEGKATVASNNIIQTLRAHVPDSDSLKHLWCREYEWYKNNFDYAIFTNRTLGKNQILGQAWPPKNTIHKIMVGGVCVAAVVKAENKFAGDGFTAIAARNMDEAVRLYTLASNYNPYEEEFARGLALAYQYKGNYDSAIMFYNKANLLRSQNYEAMGGLGQCYFYKAMAQDQNNPNQKLMAEAESYFTKAIKFKHNDANSYYFRGLIYLGQQKNYDAVHSFSAAANLNPNFSAIYVGLGKAYMNNQRADSAIYNFEIAKMIDQQAGSKNAEPYYYLAQLYKSIGDASNEAANMQTFMQLQGGALGQ